MEQFNFEHFYGPKYYFVYFPTLPRRNSPQRKEFDAYSRNMMDLMIRFHGLRIVQRSPREQRTMARVTRFYEHELSYLHQFDAKNYNFEHEEEKKIENIDTNTDNEPLTKLTEPVQLIEKLSVTELETPIDTKPKNSVSNEFENPDTKPGSSGGQSCNATESSTNSQPENSVDVVFAKLIGTEHVKSIDTEAKTSDNTKNSYSLLSSLLEESFEASWLTNEDDWSKPSLKAHLVPNPAFCPQFDKTPKI